MLVNNSDKPLLLLAGEIVTGGKQDRIVGKDRIVPAKSEPIDLDVFCVEPHRWEGASNRFHSFGYSMAQPSIRKEAMKSGNQQAVWNEVAQSRQAVADVVAGAAPEIATSSSYAQAMQNRFVQDRLDAVVGPMERTYDEITNELKGQHAIGAVVAVGGDIIWADTFASGSLFGKYWPKLLHSYAAETVSRTAWHKPNSAPSVARAQSFLDDMKTEHENVESEPGIYKTTELSGADFNAFVLTSLLPGTGYTVHMAKMKY
jgi:hypothetical protein